MESVYEQFFYLKYLGNWSFVEAYNLPVGLRTWFVTRLTKQLHAEKEQMDKASKSSSAGSSRHELSSETQALLGSAHGPPGMPKF